MYIIIIKFIDNFFLSLIYIRIFFVFIGFQGCWRLWGDWFANISLFRETNTECVRRFAVLPNSFPDSNFIYNYLSIGDLSVEEEVLQWLITQRTEDRIELITRAMLETFVEETQYLAVYFSKLITFEDQDVLYY